MHQAFSEFAALLVDDGFLGFQNMLSKTIYDQLGVGYRASEDEVALVTRLVNCTKGKSYKKIRIFAEKIHGTRSYVDFDYLDKPVTKELGDMVVISVITNRAERLFQNVCIIQNKKGKDTETRKGPDVRWDIDLEQLFLLKNFPPLTADKGILKSCGEVAFRNTTGALGAYGLLSSPGEMAFLLAPVVADLLHGRKSLANTDISLVPWHIGEQKSSFGGWLPDHGMLCEDYFHMLSKEFRHLGFPFLLPFANGFPFLGHCLFCRDIFEFARNWTQFNIGEPSCAFGRITNRPLDDFSGFVLRSAGLGENMNIGGGERFGDMHFPGDMAVFLLRMDVNEE